MISLSSMVLTVLLSFTPPADSTVQDTVSINIFEECYKIPSKNEGNSRSGDTVLARYCFVNDVANDTFYVAVKGIMRELKWWNSSEDSTNSRWYIEPLEMGATEKRELENMIRTETKTWRPIYFDYRILEGFFNEN